MGGDRGTGKTSIGLDTILNQKYEKVLCVYLPLGQKASSVLEVFLALVRRDAVFYLSMLVASAASSAVCQFLSAYREIYLLLRRPPGREAFPGEIFFVHARLLERS